MTAEVGVETLIFMLIGRIENLQKNTKRQNANEFLQELYGENNCKTEHFVFKNILNREIEKLNEQCEKD